MFMQHYMFIILRHIATLYVHHIASHCNITMFIMLQHYYLRDIVTLHCLSECDITMFVTLRQKGRLFKFQQQGNVHHIATLHCDYVQIATLLCSSHFNVNMFLVTFQYYYVRQEKYIFCLKLVLLFTLKSVSHSHI
jgi:hypothetical protein